MLKQARWMKVLVLFLAGLVAVFPSFTQVAVAQAVPAQTKTFPAQETGVILPQGEELSDAELQEVDGEGALVVVSTAIVVGAVAAGMEYQSERIRGEKINAKVIAVHFAGGAVGGFIGGGGLGMTRVAVRALSASALRWTARAAAAMSLRARVAYGFNRYIGGPVVRTFGRLFGK